MKTRLLVLLLCALSHAAILDSDAISARVNGEMIISSKLAAQTAPEERALREKKRRSGRPVSME